MLTQNNLKTPAPSHAHGKVTDTNVRLKQVYCQLSRSLDRLRSTPAGDEAERTPSRIANSLLEKLNDTSDLIHELEVLANEYEQWIGAAEEDVPKQIGRAV